MPPLPPNLGPYVCARPGRDPATAVSARGTRNRTHCAWRHWTALGLLVLALSRWAWADAVLTDCSATSLRNALASGGTVRLDCNGIISLDAPILISRDTTLEAASGRTVVLLGSLGVGGSSTVQIFRVAPGVRFTLNNLTLANGRSTNGGAIHNAGWLSVNGCVFSNNFAVGLDGAAGAPGRNGGDGVGGDGGNGGHGGAGAGGAIYNVGTALISHCSFLTNCAFGGDGGAGGRGGDGAFCGGDGGNGGNGGSAWGGAIYSLGTLALTNCTFLYNYAVGGQAGPGGTNGSGALPSYRGRGGAGGASWGGAVCSLGDSTVWGCAFGYNHAFSADSAWAGTDADPVSGADGPDSFGGGFCNRGTNRMVNCTFYANTANGGRGGDGANTDFLGGDGGRGGSAWGGNYYNQGASWLTNCTLAAGGAFPARGGTGGNSATNRTGPFPGDNGAAGISRGGNVANGSGSFALANCLLALAPAGTNVISFTNVSALTTNIAVEQVVVTSQVYGLTNCTIVFQAACTNAVVLSNTVLITEEESYWVPSSPRSPGECSPVPSDCLTVVVRTNLVNGFLQRTTNTVVRDDPDCWEDTCVDLVVTTNVVSLRTVVFTNTFVPPNSPCFTTACMTNLVLTNLVVSNATVFLGFQTNVIQVTNITVGVNAYGTFIDGGYNLSSDATPSFSATNTSRNKVDLQVGSFGHHGGPTPTLDLQPTSPAIDAANPAWCLPTDQRGVPRLYGARCDVGAFELAAFRISGRVTDGQTGLAGVTIRAETDNDQPSRFYAVTSHSGDYLLLVPPGTYTVSAEHSRYTFNPASRTVVVETLGHHGSGNDFTGFTTYSIQGQVTYAGLGLPGVQVSVDGQTIATDSLGNYTIRGLPPGTYTVVPYRYGYSFTPAQRTIVITNADIAGIDFVGSGRLKVGGQVRVQGEPLAGVQIAVGPHTVLTDALGYYVVSNLPPGNLVITATLAGYRFEPPLWEIELATDRLDLDFEAEGMLTLRGRIVAAGQPLVGVLVWANAHLALTDAAGRYVFTDLLPGYYVVTPEWSGYAFDPPSQEVDLITNVEGVDFVGYRLFTIAGRITAGATPLAGVAVSIGDSVVVETDERGFYLATVPAGTYEVVPDLAGAEFNPPARTVTVGPDATTVNFQAALYEISGRITFEGVGLGGVTLQVGDRTVQTDPDGFYRVSGLLPGQYDVEPELAGYEFDPPFVTINLGASATGLDFVARGTLVITGLVRKNNRPLAGVTLTAGPRVTVTTDLGVYFLTNLPPGTYTVTPALAGHFFEPTSQRVTLTTEDAFGVNFTAYSADTLRISLARMGNAVLLTVRAPPGGTYQVQTTPRLGPAASWQVVASNLVAGTNGLFQFQDTVASNRPAQFYRVVR